MAKREMPVSPETEVTVVDIMEEPEPREASEETEVEVTVEVDEDPKTAEQLNARMREARRRQIEQERASNRFADGARQFANSIVEDTIIPGAKNILIDIAQRVAGMFVECIGDVLGIKVDTRRSSGRVNTGIQRNRRSRAASGYRDYSTRIPERSTMDRRGGKPKPPQAIKFGRSDNANAFLENIIDECMDNGGLTLTAFYESLEAFVQEPVGNYNDWSYSNWGWFPEDLEGAKVVWDTNGYYLDIPDAHKM